MEPHRAAAAGQRLGQIEHLGQQATGPLVVERAHGSAQPQLLTGGGEDPGQRVDSRLAATVLVGVQHRAGEARSTGQLGLAQVGVKPRFGDEFGGNTLMPPADAHGSMLANPLTNQ